MYKLGRIGKILIVVLVLGMVAGTVATIAYYAGDRSTTDPFADVPAPVIGSLRYSDFTGKDVSSQDFRDEGSVFSTFTFDSASKWPGPDNMPGLLPEEIMNDGKYLGLGLKRLHKAGVTGKGVGVAFIDRPILQDHQDLSGNMTYTELDPEGNGFPYWLGAACASILAGKKGVAPGAHLYYFAVPYGGYYNEYARALEEVMKVQETLQEDEKIRVIAFAQGIDASVFSAESSQAPSGADELVSLIQQAKDQGIIVLYPGMAELDFTGTGCRIEEDRDDPGNYEIWSWASVKREITQKLRERRPRSWKDARKLLIQFLTEEPGLDSLQAEAINTLLYLMEFEKKTEDVDQWLARVGDYGTGALAVPVDYLTVAGISDPSAYTYFGAGHLSFATPYVAGLIALGVQVKPDLTMEDALEALIDTAIPFVSGHKLVNPAGFIKALSVTGTE